MSVCSSSRAFSRRLRLSAGLVAATVAVVPALSACHGSGGGSSASSSAPAGSGAGGSGSSGGAQGGASSSPATAPAGTEPGIVAVTKAGALVQLDPATGAVRDTLVASGVTGDQVSVASNGTVYFATGSGCAGTIKSIPAGGGAPAVVGSGWDPAVSPDGSMLAYAAQPGANQTCPGWDTGTPGTAFRLGILALAGGATIKTIPQVPAGQQALPGPISHLSWAPDNQHVAVSIASVQDNEGWAVNIVDTKTAQSYLDGPGVSSVPVTGDPTPQQSYLREGVYMPGGNLFVSRACCGGFPPHNTSRLMWEVAPNGMMTHQVAIGFPAIDHVSLDVSSDGNWLLYLGGNDLYVSQGGARPSQVASGLIAAAWG
jgi:hypothetical protein